MQPRHTSFCNRPLNVTLEARESKDGSGQPAHRGEQFEQMYHQVFVATGDPGPVGRTLLIMGVGRIALSIYLKSRMIQPVEKVAGLQGISEVVLHWRGWGVKVKAESAVDYPAAIPGGEFPNAPGAHGARKQVSAT
jgi:hypothetical protein